MDFSDASSWLLVPLQILFVDLLLGADNAIVIALACRSLPPKDVRSAAAIGVGGAIFLRLIMTMVATTLLTVPLVKLIGALVLAIIAMNILAGDGLGQEPSENGPRGASSLWSAAAVIIVADAAMSLDNVVALAAIARGNFWLLAIGVALSLPVLAYGGVILTALLKRAPGLVEFGAALLGWIAGGMAISDPLVAPWTGANAAGLVAMAPALGAAFVFFYGRLVAPAMRVPAPVAQTLPAPTPAFVADAPEPALEPAPATQFELSPLGDRSPEPEDRREPPAVPASRDDRAAIIGVLLLAVAAGTILMVVSFLDSYN